MNSGLQTVNVSDNFMSKREVPATCRHKTKITNCIYIFSQYICWYYICKRNSRNSFAEVEEKVWNNELLCKNKIFTHILKNAVICDLHWNGTHRPIRKTVGRKTQKRKWNYKKYAPGFLCRSASPGTYECLSGNSWI